MSKNSRPSSPSVAIALATAFLLASGVSEPSFGADSSIVQRIVDHGRKSSRVMDYLSHLTNEIGPRPVGSKNHHEACEWALRMFDGLGLSNVHLEEASYVTAYPDADWAKGYLETRSGVSMEGDGTAEELVPVYNVVADIPGTERPDEYVVIGAHFDSVPIGTGALDNGCGVAAVMEAARLLVESGARPMRTIRCVLFAGEESGRVGSKGYVQAHPQLMQKISAVYNMDRGTHYISGISATAPLKEDLGEAFAPVVGLEPEMPFEICLVDYLPMGDLGCSAAKERGRDAEQDKAAVVEKTIKWNPDGSVLVMAEGYETLRLGPDDSVGSGDSLANEVVLFGAFGGAGAVSDSGRQTMAEKPATLGRIEGANVTGGGEAKKEFVIAGGSDHIAFLMKGVPAFWWIQEGDPTVGYPAHTRDDTYDKAIPRHLEHSATVIAVGALGTANLDHMLSRERLAEPEAN